MRVSLDDDIDDLIHISVQDLGRGISPEHQSAVPKFSQGDPSITRQYGGTGLGLSDFKTAYLSDGRQYWFYDNATEQAG